MVICIQFCVKDDIQSRSYWAFRKNENLIFSKFWHGEILKIMISDKSIARFCTYSIELYTLAEHSRTTYGQCKKEPLTGHNLEYEGEWVWRAKTSEGNMAVRVTSTCIGHIESGTLNGDRLFKKLSRVSQLQIKCLLSPMIHSSSSDNYVNVN